MLSGRTRGGPISVLRHLPNVVTGTRGLCGPVVLWLLLVEGAAQAAFVLFVVAASTDLFDGVLARTLGSDPRLGALLDPLADRLLGGCAWLGLLATGRAPWWLVVPLLVRDTVVAAGWSWYRRRRGLVVHASPLGQIATSFEATSLGILLFPGQVGDVHWPSVGVVVGLVGVVLSFLSALGYALSPPAEAA